MARTQSWQPRDASQITHLYTEATSGPPYTVHFDEWLTRRKRFHIITDRTGAVVFRSRWVADVIDWLDTMGMEGYSCRLAGRRWLVRWEPVPANEELPA